MVADGHPRAPGGDAEGLVVVAVRPARGERVAQPEPAPRSAVGEVGERGRAPVGGDHQVGVVAVAPAGDGDDLVTTTLSVTSSRLDTKTS